MSSAHHLPKKLPATFSLNDLNSSAELCQKLSGLVCCFGQSWDQALKSAGSVGKVAIYAKGWFEDALAKRRWDTTVHRTAHCTENLQELCWPNSWSFRIHRSTSPGQIFFEFAKPKFGSAQLWHPRPFAQRHSCSAHIFSKVCSVCSVLLFTGNGRLWVARTSQAAIRKDLFSKISSMTWRAKNGNAHHKRFLVFHTFQDDYIYIYIYIQRYTHNIHIIYT